MTHICSCRSVVAGEGFQAETVTPYILCEQEETPMKSDEEIMAETKADVAKLGAALEVLDRLIAAAGIRPAIPGTPAGEEREALVVAHVAVQTERVRLEEWVKAHGSTT